MLATRILLGTLMILVLVGLVVLDIRVSEPQAGPEAVVVAAPWWGWPTAAAVAVLGAWAALELVGILRAAGEAPVRWWAVPVTVGLIVLPWVGQLQATRMAAVGVDAADPGCPSLLWLTGGFLGTCLAVLARKRTDGAIRAIALTVLVFVYAGLLGSFLVRIRCLDAGPAGAALVLYTILVVKSCDIGAYLLGRKVGHTPLAAWLSPGKTTEGFAGGLVLACGVASAAWLTWGRWGGPALGSPPFSIIQALIFAIVMATVGHLGDLVESIFKRDLGVKDSGRVVPAFGGVLDMLDSPWFAAPLAWWLLTIFGRVG